MNQSLLSIRIPEEEKRRLERMANSEGMALSSYLRRLIKRHLNSEQAEISTAEKTLINSSSQLLYIIRLLADRVDPNAREDARDFARKTLEQFMGQRQGNE